MPASISFSLPCWNRSAKRLLLKHQLEDGIEALVTAIEEYMQLVEGQQFSLSETSPEWLKSAEATMSEAEKLIRGGPHEIDKLSLTGCCPRNYKSTSRFKERLATCIKDVISLITSLKDILHIELGTTVVGSMVHQVDLQPIGLEAMVDAVWNCLMNDGVGIIGLHGLGGIGKTTLLSQINEKFLREPNGFDIVICVTISRDSRLEKVQEDVWTKMKPIHSEDGYELWQNGSTYDKAINICTALQEKKYVLLLDDMWEPIYLEKVGIPHPQRNGSKIVFTTRSEQVCRKMEAQINIKIEPLKPEDAWKLFQEKAGVEKLGSDPDICSLAQAVAKECGGVPAALVTVARAMAGLRTVEEWKHGLHVLKNSPSEIPGMGDTLFPILKFSYDSLPSEQLKTCFLYCALIPKDFKILKEDIVDYWICEGFLDFYDYKVDAHSMGYHIIGTLVREGLLQDEGKYIKMHSLVRDMALSIIYAQEEVLVQSGSELVEAPKIERGREVILVQSGSEFVEAPKIERGQRIKRMSLMETSIRNLTEVLPCPYLTTLFLSQNRHLSTITDGFFESMYALTVLDLSHSSINELPLEISKLVSLQHLNISHTWIEQLPIQLQMLSRLKCLKLEHNGLLRSIPRQVISGLLSLQILRMFSCGVSLVDEEDNILSYRNEHVDELQTLEHLNVLSITITSTAALQSFFNIPRLRNCTRGLSLKCFWDTRSVDISLLATIKDLQMLEIYHIDGLEELNVGFTIKGKEIQKPGSLQNAAIPRERSFNGLQEVIVGKCLHLRDLTWVILAPNLTVLKVTSCREMDEIISNKKLGAEVLNVAVKHLNPLSKLEVLEIEKLPKLKSIYWKSQPFPCLKKIKVLDCPMLKKLPLNSSSVGSKVVIEAKEHWWNAVEWEDDDTRNALQHSFIQITD